MQGMAGIKGKISRFFLFEDLKTDLKTEVLAGITTFLATMYIIFVHPGILKAGGLPFQGVLTATILVSALSSLLMGLYAKNPIVLAPGMGLNAFFVYTVVLGLKVPWQQALGAVFWSGMINLVLSLLNVRVSIVKGIPKDLRYGVAAGIGLFISLLGLINGGQVTSHPATIIGKGALNPSTITFWAGVLLVSIFMIRKIKGAFILGILLTTLLSIPLGRWWGGDVPLVQMTGIWAWPDFSLLFQADLAGAFRWELLPIIFSFAFTDLFDSISTFIGVAEAGNLLDKNGEPLRVKESLLVDSLATVISGPLGTSAATSYIESAAGVEEGGRSGLTAVVAGLLFLPFLFFSPLLSLVPSLATAPVLVLVGILMAKTLTKINWQKFDEAIPAFLSFLLIPFTFSITQGLIWGFLSWTVLKLLQGKFSAISPVLWGIDVFCLLALYFH